MRSFSVVTVALSVGFFAGDLFGQCANGGGTTVSAGATQSASSARRLTPSASISGASGVPRRGSFSVGSVPQVSSFRMGSGTSALNSFQTHQLMNYRALAESGVRNRRSPERKQQMLATNAERAYRAGLSAEKSGRVYSARKQYERAAAIAPGTIAAKYAEDALLRLSR